MVRVTSFLLRIPVIKFRKGASPVPAASATASTATPPPPSGQTQAAAAMSTGVISDIDLPLRYRRTPLSQEEIDLINGGGVA